MPPYDLAYVSAIHRHLFAGVHAWAGELRTVDISKGSTRFCTVDRIAPESAKIFTAMTRLQWFDGMDRKDLVRHAAESFGDFNVIHPFREGNGRVQRIVFEQLIIHAGYEISWVDVEPDDWVDANVAAYQGDYSALATIFDACIGKPIQEADFE